MAVVAGVDSSTQSTKVLVWDTESQQILRQGSAPHPEGTSVNPERWWEAFISAAKQAGGLADVEAVSVGAQQHGLVTLDQNGTVVRDALLWNDTRSAAAAKQLVEEKGLDFWVESCGCAPVASLTITKLRWLVDHEPQSWSRVAAVCLPHDWLSWRIQGSADIHSLFTDRSDASGTAYLDTHIGEYRYDLLAHALRIPEDKARQLVLPKVVSPQELGGEVTRDIPEIELRAGTKIAPGYGDNAGAALGLGLRVGEAAISIGTSCVVSVVSDKPVIDKSGSVTGFMDATGNWLPLACTLNGTQVMDKTAALLGVDVSTFDQLALQVPDTDGLQMIPYFQGERTPNLPNATAEIRGMTLRNYAPAHLARAAVEGLVGLIDYALQAIQGCGVEVNKATLIGGGAKSPAVTQILPSKLGIEIEVAPPGEYVALGAAKQAGDLIR
ncbi:FGGY family carbohydrate kinase [uncultured Mobiluncus sp.]|uniref:xylulokinase n=1 Tax=uncultured Mobiluncus sp. TaxID=293425 RepID=UPI00288AEEDE|nr:FGGY family carbohydrate kinase [uncultured Mobiluncus sp.]